MSEKPSKKSQLKAQSQPLFACIDMGTNSFHMIVCHPRKDRHGFETVMKVKESVPFFREALSAHFIDEEAAGDAIRILRHMKEKANQNGEAHVVAVATSAVRESRNGEDVLRRVRRELGIDARMISGYEEARLIYLGVLCSMPELVRQFGIIDIGGGSTEIIVGDRDQIAFSETYKLGAARLTLKYFKKGTPTPSSLAELHEEVCGMLVPAAANIKLKGGFRQLIGTSGTVQALAKIDRNRQDDSQHTLMGWVLPLSRLEAIVEYIETMSLQGRKVEHVGSDRSQTLLAGSVVLLEAMRALGVHEISVCTAALREGVVVDHYLQTNQLKAASLHHRDPRSESIHALLEKYHADSAHAQQVANLATAIFRQSRGQLHNYPDQVCHLLWAAGMLHDIGTFIGRIGHHKHSYYLIKNGGLLGHSQEEVELVANIARYHRGAVPKESHTGYAGLSSKEKLLVLQMSAILRLAEALDRGRRQVVKEVRVSVEPGKKNGRSAVDLNLKLKNGLPCDAEAWAFKERKGYFEDQFQCDLDLTIFQTA